MASPAGVAPTGAQGITARSCSGTVRSTPARNYVDLGSVNRRRPRSDWATRVSPFRNGSHRKVSTRHPSHAACQPTRRALRDGALTKQNARVYAIRSPAHQPSIVPVVSRAHPHRNDLGRGSRPPGDLFTARASSREAVPRGPPAHRSWSAAVCSAPQLIRVAPDGDEMGGLRGCGPECGTECSLSGMRPGMWEQAPTRWTR
jgi:hypothetical protein